MKNTEGVIRKANAASSDTIRKIYSEIDRHRKDALEIYARFSDRIMTGLKDPAKIAERKESLKKDIQSRDIWIGLDPNGGARKDKEYLESWGFHVLEINGRPCLDMVQVFRHRARCHAQKCEHIELGNDIPGRGSGASYT